jgi:dolichol-phosphate mannosyltransferase
MISIVIPCCNEAAGLPYLFARVSAAAADWHDDWEVLLIDDGSRDATWQAIERLHHRDPRWKGIALARNFGHQAAIGAGLEHARGDALVILDADLQDPPELIADMLARWHEGHDVVYGIRARRPEAWWKRCCYAGFYALLARLTEVAVPRHAGDFCLLDRRVVAALGSFREQYPYWRGLRSWCGFRQVGLPYDRAPRQAGQSQYSWRKLLGLARDGILALSRTPLRAISWLGGAATLGILLLGAWSMLAGSAPASALLWTGLFLGSVQILCLGVMARYLGRIHDEVRQRPRWIVAATIGLNKKPNPKSEARNPKRIRISKHQ